MQAVAMNALPAAPAENSACAYCGLPARAPRGGGPAWCCLGCRLAQEAGGGGPVRFLEARLVLSAFLAVGLMEFSMALYGASVYDAVEDEGLILVRSAGRLILPLFAVPVLLLLGVPMLRGAARDLRGGAVRLEGLVVLATIAAFGLSLWNTLQGTGEVYYETAAMVLVLVAFGRRLEARSRMESRDAAVALCATLPQWAWRCDAASEPQQVAPESLRPGDVVVIRPGESVPADAVVQSGSSEITAAHLTGEQAPRAVACGAAIDAGAVNGTGTLRARVTAAVAEGSLGRVRKLLEAPLPRTRLLRLTDKLSGWLALVAVVLAAYGAWRSTLQSGAGEGLRTALAVLLVACPCALGLAIPLAFHALRTRLARAGVLVEEAVALEVAPDIDTVVFDKTGTLSDPASMRIAAQGGSAAALRRLYSVVAASRHALAAALPAASMAEDVQVLPGLGAVGTTEGICVHAGSAAWIEERCGAGIEILAAARRAAMNGASVVVSAEAGQVVAFVAVEQSLRPSAAGAVARLKARGLRVLVLSGDRAESAAALGRELQVEAVGQLRPEDKLRLVEELRAQGRKVLVVGDGLNDAPMLRHADVALSMGGGTAAARSQAQVDVLRDDLNAVPLLLSAARALRSTIRGNIFWTLFYNGLALVLATLGLLNPLIAAAAMIISSLVVSARSLRLLHRELPA